jgi:BlaR1 peptidase M56
VRSNAANRSFAALVALAASALFALCAAAFCVLLSLIAVRIGRDGLGALTDQGENLLPALLFMALAAAGGLLGVRSLALQARASRRLAEQMDALALPPPAELAAASARAGLVGRVTLVNSSERFSFAYGAVSPRVAVSRGLFEAASADELGAVLAHERYHVRALDPIKVVLARALPAALFYLPVLRDLRSRYVAGRELAADRRAIESCGRAPLAGALLKVAEGPGGPKLAAAAAVGGPELLDVRIAQLERREEPRLERLSARGLALSALGASALMATFIASVAGLGGPSAVADEAGVSVEPLDLALGLVCIVPWLAGAVLVRRHLLKRAQSHTQLRHKRSTIPPS